ncbi:MAG: hypothetical protein RAO92_03195 [Candidatus Euphemobacter frigidus]|nr:hypothetical protein [Candidatus Euphemobacter frigidus]MDP8275386.1 hypothetical protein [Candidatus Euphemobacter frigidus]
MKALLRHARELAPKERENFLAIFAGSDESVTEPVDDPELISDINAFIKDLEKGEYCDGWGYDPEIGDERAFGDETWTVEMDDLFERAAEVFLSGNRSLAMEAYGLLLHAFELKEESGTFSGPVPPESMVATDVDEAKARYLCSLYETATPDKRVACLLNEIHALKYTGSSRVGLRAIIEADDKTLKALNAFLPEWLRALREESPENDYGWDKLFPWLLREAVVLLEGTDGLARLAEEEGDRHPEAYFDLVLTLIKEEKPEEAIAAAGTGVNRIIDPVKRAMLADQLAELAIEAGDGELCITGRRRAWRSDPTIKRLMLLCGAGNPDNDEIDRRLHDEWKWYKESVARPNKRLTAILQLLAGEYETPVTTLSKTKPLGWSNPQHPGPVVYPFLLLAGSGGDKPEARSVMAGFFSGLDALERDELVLDLQGEIIKVPAGYKRLSDLLFISLQRYPVTPEQRREFLKAAKSIALKRVCAIVSKKHRNAYERAARVLIGCIEALESAGQKKEGEALLKKVKEEFPRHSAFWGEIRSLPAGKKRLDQLI